MHMIAMAAGFVLILMGLYAALTHRNILRMIVGFSLADTGVHVVLVAVGYMPGRAAPILDAAITDPAAQIIDPVPQALVLTAIVIGLGVTALMLAYAYRLFRARRSLDISKFTELKW